MIGIKEHLQEITQTLSDYIQLNMKLAALKVSEKSSKILSDFFSLVILLVVFVFALIFISIGAAKWIGSIFDNEWGGFFIVGGFYILTGLILIFMKKTLIQKPLLNAIVKGIFVIEEKAEDKVEDIEEKLVDKLDNNN